MEHHFNVEIAKTFGVDCAVFIHNIYFWLIKNEANGRHFHDGKTWTYNSMVAFSTLCPYWSEGQVRRIIERLKKAGVLLTGSYNDDPRDRTQWYTLSDEIYEIYSENSNLHLSKSTNGCVEIDRPLPYNKPYNKQDISRGKGKKKKYGEFGNVELLDEEHAKLVDCVGDRGVTTYIERLSAYIAQSGKKYKSHYATILNWWRKDGEPIDRSPEPFTMKPDKVRVITPEMTMEEIF